MTKICFDEVLMGIRIKKIREDHGMTVEAFAEALDVSTNAVYKWQRGNTPDLVHVSLISRMFGVTTDFLIFGEGGDELPSSII